MLFPYTTVLDGGLGQELYRKGVRGHDVLWSANALLTDPDAVRAVHLDFIRAGARVITTNTYCTTLFRFREVGIEDRFAELNRLACRLAQEARDEAGIPEVQIAGCLPPLYGSYRPDRVRPVEQILPEYRQLADVLAPHVDLLLAETISTVDEGYAAAAAATATGLPTWLAWTLTDDGRPTLRSGESLTDAAARLEPLPVQAYLINCCAPESVGPGLDALRAVTDRPIGAYANGFTPIPANWQPGNIEGLGVRRDLGPDAYAAFVREWIARGAAIVGGCCEIGPAHIARIAKDLASDQLQVA